MISDARTVEEYLTELPDERREALTVLRNLIVEVVPDARELMRNGHPRATERGRVTVLSPA